MEELAKRAQCIKDLQAAFESAMTEFDDGISFGLEAELTEDTLKAVSQQLNLRDTSIYVSREKQTVQVDTVQELPAQFLQSLASGSQKVKQGANLSNLAGDILTATPEIRFFAMLDDDRIGGFRRSSMTPGKQALFALTLILDESEEAWPLLIDQPEDDLDSRSIYDHIVPYLVKRKTERQILMVSHNANLVVGADSEQIIVANRNGDDRRNRDGRTFDYLCGSLEHSSRKTENGQYVLESCGIREHTCEILDGGAEAFQKRRDKYKL